MSKDRFFSGGGQSEIDALESELTIKHTVLSSSHTFRYGVDDVYKSGHVVYITANIQITSAAAAYTDIAIIPNGYRPLQAVYGMDTVKKVGIQVSETGKIQCDTALAVNDVIAFTLIYLSQ